MSNKNNLPNRKLSSDKSVDHTRVAKSKGEGRRIARRSKRSREVEAYLVNALHHNIGALTAVASIAVARLDYHEASAGEAPEEVPAWPIDEHQRAILERIWLEFPGSGVEHWFATRLLVHLEKYAALDEIAVGAVRALEHVAKKRLSAQLLRPPISRLPSGRLPELGCFSLLRTNKGAEDPGMARR